MALYYRRDDWVQDAMGNAIPGAAVYVCSQPSVPPSFDDETGAFIPPSPQVALYKDAAGTMPLAQPVQTDGYGHAYYYTAAGTYTVYYSNPQIGVTTLADQVIVAPNLPVTTATPSPSPNGVNTVFTLPSTPTNFLMFFLNGVLQLPEDNYSLSFNRVTLFVAPSPDDQLFAVFQ